jgi:hypothetical protein
MGVIICSLSFAGGCGGGVEEGSVAKFDPDANKKQQDAMREFMQKQKQKPGASKTGAKAK